MPLQSCTEGSGACIGRSAQMDHVGSGPWFVIFVLWQHLETSDEVQGPTGLGAVYRIKGQSPPLRAYNLFRVSGVLFLHKCVGHTHLEPHRGTFEINLNN